MKYKFIGFLWTLQLTRTVRTKPSQKEKHNHKVVSPIEIYAEQGT